jgi:hypothetical protein
MELNDSNEYEITYRWNHLPSSCVAVLNIGNKEIGTSNLIEFYSDKKYFRKVKLRKNGEVCFYGFSIQLPSNHFIPLTLPNGDIIMRDDIATNQTKLFRLEFLPKEDSCLKTFRKFLYPIILAGICLILHKLIKA